MLNESAPPYDKEAERSVIYSLLMDNTYLKDIKMIISADDFYMPANREIYAAMLSLSESGTPVDIVTVKQELGDKFDLIGGIDYLKCILTDFSTTIFCKSHAEIIRNLSNKRNIIFKVHEIMRNNDPTIDDLKNVLEDAENRRLVKNYEDVSDSYYQTYRENLKRQKKRIFTGFKSIDWTTGGLRLPSMAIIGAYPSVGKTAFALNVCMNQNLPVVFFSLEMNFEQIMERLESAEIGINYGLFNSQKLTDENYNDIDKFVDRMKDKNFYIFDDKYYVEQHAEIINSIKPALVVVDYVQIVRTMSKQQDRRREMDYICSLYKTIAKENECCCLALSQLSRDKNLKYPTMQLLKETGGLEENGDCIGILHRPYVLNKNDEELKEEDGYLLIEKNKFGKTGKVNLFFKGEHQKFYESFEDFQNPFM